ncbi:hypothetical protein KTT_39280 [Tengunoibacter tsumagoiensis]|uniref:Uncharacterized protein n=1 Tax=Tengunoibacter tsumagoiensis TaxID=2014871 RepID=A0A402A4T3_9CHLR|nr:hypothetical protein KTT_39280 [Tengunoibacter tsumagoiensis]
MCVVIALSYRLTDLSSMMEVLLALSGKSSAIFVGSDRLRLWIIPHLCCKRLALRFVKIISEPASLYFGYMRLL